MIERLRGNVTYRSQKKERGAFVNKFALVIALLVLVSCSSTMTATSEPDVIVIEVDTAPIEPDTGAVEVSTVPDSGKSETDARDDAAEIDSSVEDVGSDVPADTFVADAATVDTDTPDAAPDAPPPILTVIPEGPAARTYPTGTVGAELIRFRLVVGSRDLHLWWLPVTLEGVTRSDFLQGSEGTNYLFNRRMLEIVTGAVVSPPYSLRMSGNAQVFRHPDTLIQADAPMQLRAGSQYVLVVLVDIGTHEDAPGELFDGTHAYRCSIGGRNPVDRDNFFRDSTIADAMTGERYSADRIAGNVPMIGNPMTVVHMP